MSSYSVAHAKKQLSKLIDEALHGETVTITRHGKPVVEMRALETPASIRKPSANLIDRIAAEAKSRGRSGLSGVDLVRQMRDEERQSISARRS